MLIVDVFIKIYISVKYKKPITFYLFLKYSEYNLNIHLKSPSNSHIKDNNT